MFKYIGGICAVALLAGAFFITTGCAANKTFTVGKDIQLKEVQEFYFTESASTNPPYYQRYLFSNKTGKQEFYHEKREGNEWPLREKHITVHGTIALTDKQWQLFFDLIKDGEVTKRVEDPRGGGRGPWLYLYWSKDKGKYQVFKFANLQKQKDFEALCLALKGTK